MNIEAKRVETVIFNDLLRVEINKDNFSSTLYNNCIFPAEALPSTIVTYETLAGLLKTYRPDYNLNAWNESTTRTAQLIEQSLSEYPKEIQEILRADIMDLTYYYQYGLDYWDITRLCLKYNIDPIKIFVSLVADATPFGMGMIPFIKVSESNIDDLARQDFQKQLNEPEDIYGSKNDCPYIYYDYWNGIAVKTTFPKNINEKPMRVSIRSYNDRNNDMGYARIIKLFATQLMKPKQKITLV